MDTADAVPKESRSRSRVPRVASAVFRRLHTRNWKSGIRDGMFWKPCYLIPCCLYRIKSALVTLCLVLFPIFIGRDFLQSFELAGQVLQIVYSDLFRHICNRSITYQQQLGKTFHPKVEDVFVDGLLSDLLETNLNKRRDNGTCFTISDTVISAAIF